MLYLTDNCGGIYFGKFLILPIISMGLDVTAAVRGMAVINDVTIEDAEYCGIDTICPFITNGAGIPGTSLDHFL